MTNNPSANTNGGQRYLWPRGATFYYLCNYVKKCHNYTLEFDLVTPYSASSGSLTVAFTNNIVSTYSSPTFTYSFSYNFTTSNTSWQHLTVPNFWYCGDSSNILMLQNTSSPYYDIRIDNISLKENLSPPALSATISNAIQGNCTTNLTANPTNAACDTTYYWSNNVNSSHPTTRTINIPSNVTATYTVIVSDGCRSDTVSTTITAPTIPSVSVSPAGPTALCSGSSLTLTATPNSSSYSYQWYNGSTLITGATSASFTTSIAGSFNFQLTDAATHCYLATSASNVVSIIYAPAITSQPSSITICAGSNTSFGVTASGAGLTYQWQVNPGSGFVNVTNGGMYSGATTNTLTITGALTTMTGYIYRCIVSGTCSPSATSNSATLTVNPIPTVTPGISNQGVCNGSNTSAVTFTGTNITSYNWTNSNTTIGLSASSGTGSIFASFIGINTGSTNISTTITVTPVYAYNGVSCTGTSTSFTITVYPSPPATITSSVGGTQANDSVCSGSSDTLHANTGTGLSYQWQSGPTWTNIPGATSSTYTVGSATTTTSYRVIVTESTHGCKDTSATKTIVVMSGLCPCSVFQNYNSFKILSPAGSPYTSSNLPAGHNYYVSGDITFSGPLTLDRVYIAIANNATIYLDTSANVAIDSSHLWNCDTTGMWKGIVLKHALKHSAMLSLDSNTLIEDADTAVEIPRAYDTTNIFSSYCAIFNRNHYGIKIDTFNTSTATRYPFILRNTVITSRDKITSSYNSWTNTDGLKTPTGTALGALQAPFGLNDPSSHPQKMCRDLRPALCGISLNSVGYTAGTSSFTYYEIPIGDGTPAYGTKYRNLVDNMKYGIWAYNTNLTLQNTVIMNDSDGIYGYTNNTNINGSLFKGRIRLNEPVAGSAFNDQFYTSKHACAELYYYYDVLGWYTKMIGAHSASAPDTSWGYKIQNMFYDSVDIQYDSLCNLTNAIDVRDAGMNFISSFPSFLPGAWATINWNTIQPNYKDSIHGYVKLGVSINVGISKTLYTGYWGRVQVNNNSIEAQNGILVNGSINQTATSRWNNIIMDRSISGKVTQYGISHTHCMNDTISYNGSTIPIGGIDTTTVMNDSCRAVYVGFTTGAEVACNAEHNVGRGYEFFGNQVQSYTGWVNNYLDTNTKGFVLNRTIIGPQGNGPYASGNVWDNTWTGGHYGTFVYDTLNLYKAINSPMHVYWPSSSNPPNNQSNIFGSNYTIPSSIISWSTAAQACLYRIIGHGTGIGPGSIRSTFKVVAADSLGLGTTAPVAAWMSQYALFRALQMDSTKIDSDAMLMDFDTLALHTRFGYLAKIENLLAAGHYGSAQCQLNNTSLQVATGTTYGSSGAIVEDSSAADTVVYTYLAFYKLYRKYALDSLSGTDSAQITYIANLCPNVYGAVVYQARSLYTMVWDDPEAWDDDLACGYAHSSTDGSSSGSGEGGRRVKPNIMTSNINLQQYSLYPNPNNGSMTLLQKIVDDNIAHVEVINSEGQNMFKKDLLFIGGFTQLNLQNLSPGLYLIVLRDTGGKSYTIKFIVN